MILGTMEDIGADTIQATGDGMTHGIITTITADGMTRHTTQNQEVRANQGITTDQTTDGTVCALKQEAAQHIPAQSAVHLQEGQQEAEPVSATEQGEHHQAHVVKPYIENRLVHHHNRPDHHQQPTDAQPAPEAPQQLQSEQRSNNRHFPLEAAGPVLQATAVAARHRATTEAVRLQAAQATAEAVRLQAPQATAEAAHLQAVQATAEAPAAIGDKTYKTIRS